VSEAFPLRNKEAETIAKVLVEQVFTRFGVPLSILSGQGKEVDGRIMNEVCRLFGIEKLRTSPYKPSTNQVERFHRTLNSILAMSVSEHQKDWDDRLPFAMTAYRASRHESTGYSPNFLVLGREARLPRDIVYGSPDEEPAEDYDRFVERVRERTTTAFAGVRENLKRSAERNKRYYNLGIKSKCFEVGPRKLRGKQMKWKRQYEGPLLVIRTHSSVTAEIQKSAKTRTRVVHIDKLKEYVGKPPKSWLAAAHGELDEVSPLGEAGASAERATRSTLDGGDYSEEPEEVDRAKSPEEAVEKSSAGRVTAEAKSSSDNVSEGARRDEEAEAKESPQERSLVENTFNEKDRRIYEVDEKPEGRPRRRILRENTATSS